MKNIKIISVAGKPDGVQLPNMRIIRRPKDDKIFIPELGGTFICAPYDNHFIYYDNDPEMGGSKVNCSCGSMASVVGYNAYKKDQSPTKGSVINGAMAVCTHHSIYGKHSDGSG